MAKNDILDHPDLRKVWDRLETDSPQVEWSRLTTKSLEPTRTQPRGLWIALAAFVVVLGVGGVALLDLGDDSASGGPLANLDWDIMVTLPAPGAPQAFVEQIEAIEGVTNVDYYPNAAVFYSSPPSTEGGENVVETTIAGSPPTGDEPTPAVLLLQIEDPAEAEAIAHVVNQGFDTYHIEYSSEVAAPMADRYFDAISEGAVVIGEDPLILQVVPGPEPEFDTAALGTEVEVLPATDAADIPDMFWERLGFSPEDPYARSLERPVLHIGYVPELDSRLVVYGTVGGGRCESTIGRDGMGSGCGDFTRYRYGVTSYGSGEGGVSSAEVEVPLGTSVVTISVDGGPFLWQRPVAGWALFPAEIQDDDFTRFTVDAYDATGASLGHWEQ